MNNLYDLYQWVSWNLFLALIPVLLAYVIPPLVEAPGKKSLPVKVLVVLLGVIWLLFLPNTCYLLTEWRHFFEELDRANMYSRLSDNVDMQAIIWAMTRVLFYFCYSGIGMLAFALAIRPMAQLMKRLGIWRWLLAPVFFTLMSLGVYLGLRLRFNSWDVFHRLGNIWAAVLEAFSHPVLLAFIVAFGGLLWLSYLVIDIWIDGLQARWGKTGRGKK